MENLIDIPGLLPVERLTYAYGPPEAKARIRASFDDFVVEEQLGFEPEGEGSHAMLQLRKRGLNTQDVALRLARLVGVRSRDIGYSGLKDRNAVTTQWFSVALEGVAEPDWATLNGDDLELLTLARARRKLRKGAHKRNRFILTLRELDGDRDALDWRLRRIREEGVPNYFGVQRFGREGGNLAKAFRLFSGTLKVRDRHRRGLYISAARSMLFNRVLSLRTGEASWNRPLPGDVMMLEGSHSIFEAGEPDGEIVRRMEEGDIHPTGPLWGSGSSKTTGEAREREERVLAECSVWLEGLEAVGLKQERRALRLPVGRLEWDFFPDAVLRLIFSLPAGAYATSVLRELIRER